MCGIFGVSHGDRSRFTPDALKATMADLFRLSESRGKEAAGVAVLSDDAIEVLKSSVAASSMLSTREYRRLLDGWLPRQPKSNDTPLGRSATLFGHSRLVTHGSQDTHDNNQPVIAGRAVGVHNGIITNHTELWRQFPSLERRYEVDTEIVLSLMRHFYDERGSLTDAVREVFGAIEGVASIAVLFADLDCLLLATNNGSLWRCIDEDGTVVIFASERHILNVLTRRRHVQRVLGRFRIEQLPPGQACLISTHNASFDDFRLSADRGCGPPTPRSATERKVVEVKDQRVRTPSASRNEGAGVAIGAEPESQRRIARVRARFPYDTTLADSLRRCSKCVLPETMPFIDFDVDGVCNYCRRYQAIPQRGDGAIRRLCDQHRRTDGSPDCVVGVSGGRDSVFGLHYIKSVLKMNPVAYTYDWGLVTDLARRNTARICGKLGVEHIVVSADITKKRRFVRKNVSAWLRRPTLGTVPVFMAGDKQYFYFLRQVRKQVGVDLAFLCENMLERTDFKSGFAGAPPSNSDSSHVYTLPPVSKLRMAWYYASEWVRNPAYLNESLVDTAVAYGCYYFLGRDYANLYTYIPWQEELIVPTLVDEYGFERSPDTTSTWRIGDGTAAVYNYIYYTVSGFSEHDTFRSNEIWEGLLAREDALERIREENRPRFETIDWYLKIIDLELDIEQVVTVVNQIPKRSRDHRSAKGERRGK